MRGVKQSTVEEYLFEAIEEGDAYYAEGAAKELVRRGVCLDTLFHKRDGRTPLQAAARAGMAATARNLLELGAGPDVATSETWRPLALAVLWDRLDVMRLLIEHGAEMDIPISSAPHRASGSILGWCLAERADRPEQALACADLLLELGANPFYTPVRPQQNYLTPFQAALQRANVDGVRLILNRHKIDFDQLTLAGKSLDELPKGERAGTIREMLNAKRTEQAIESGLGMGAMSDDTPTSPRYRNAPSL